MPAATTATSCSVPPGAPALLAVAFFVHSLEAQTTLIRGPNRL